MVTPAPSSTRPDDAEIWENVGSVDRTDRFDCRIGLIDRAHDQRAAGEKTRPALARQRARRIGQAGESLYGDAHARPLQSHRCGKPGTNRGKARFINVLANHPRHLLLLALARRERAAPFPERAVAVGDRRQSHMGNVVEQRNRRVHQAIAESLFKIRQSQQALAQLGTVAQEETARAAQLVRTLPALDRALGDGGMPAVMPVEIGVARAVLGRFARDDVYEERWLSSRQGELLETAVCARDALPVKGDVDLTLWAPFLGD